MTSSARPTALRKSSQSVTQPGLWVGIGMSFVLSACSSPSNGPGTDNVTISEQSSITVPTTMPKPIGTASEKEESSSASVEYRVLAQREDAANRQLSDFDSTGAINIARKSALANSMVIQEPALTTPAINTEKYQELDSNPVIRVIDEATSTFSIDVDTGSYSNVRRMVRAGQLPPHDAVRIEELLNYFDYAYTPPSKNEQPFSITTEIASTPWNSKTRLLHIGLQGYEITAADRPDANLVFLVDVSGSMSAPNKLGLLKSSINMLVKQLGKNDTVSLVVYAGASGVVLEPTSGDDHMAISSALQRLSAGGSTNGEAGIELAYAMAERVASSSSINRVILATDGDFNVGISNTERLKELIERKRQSGIALTTLGFGTGNYNDYLMEQLADTGNGNYAYIDTLNEARKVLVDEVTSTLLTIARDVKVQIEFNPAVVSEYRLIGYVNRHLANEDFNNDAVDAGEIGAGHNVTALYEIALHGEGGDKHSPSRYQQTANRNNTAATGAAEVAELRLRYKLPEQSASKLISQPVMLADVKNELQQTSDAYRFSAAVAAFGQTLTGGKYTSGYNYQQIAELARAARGQDRFGYRAEFVQLVELASALHAPR